MEDSLVFEFEKSCKNIGVDIIEGDLIKKFKPSIGTGGFGKVYKGEYKGKFVAIKKIFLSKDDTEIYNVIFNEIKNLKFIEQPFVPKFYGLWKKQVYKYHIIFEYVDGNDLRKIYDKLDRHTKLEIIRDVCEILEQLHLKKIIHRDIKPDNIMIQFDSKPFLIDFGTVKLAQHTTTYTEIQRGTFLYMAPECFDIDIDDMSDKPVPVSTYSDIWSMGCMISEIFSGVLPWHLMGGPDLNETAIQKRLTNRAVFPIPNNIDLDIVQIISRTVDFDHLNRPSAGELKKMIISMINR
jgi:hypothetical protein